MIDRRGVVLSLSALTVAMLAAAMSLFLARNRHFVGAEPHGTSLSTTPACRIRSKSC